MRRKRVAGSSLLVARLERKTCLSGRQANNEKRRTLDICNLIFVHLTATGFTLNATMMPMSPTMMFQSVGLLGGLFLPLIVLLLFAILVLPAVLHGSGRPHAVGKAAYNYLAASLGIVLMSAGGLPAVYAVFARQPLSTGSYTGLLLVFAVGGLTFLWHDARLMKMESTAKAIPASLFFFTWKFIGLLVSLFAGLSFVLRILAQTDTGSSDWWVIHLIMLLYGLLLSWFTISQEGAAVKPAAHALPMKAVKAVKGKR